MYNIQIAVAKTNKYASRESGDTVEVVERPQGGFSVILADGQGSGQSAKGLSHMVTTKVIGLIKDGVRDGVAARAVSDYLYSYRSGKVSATLIMVSVDLATSTIVLLSNSHCPILLSNVGGAVIASPQLQGSAIGLYASTRPMMSEVPIHEHTWVVAYSDGLMEAGMRSDSPIDLPVLITSRLAEGVAGARQMADYLLECALRLDSNRPADDMTVAVLAILPMPDEAENKIVPLVRRMEITVPV